MNFFGFLFFVFVLMHFIFYFLNFYFSSVEHTDISSGFHSRVLGFSLYVSNIPNRSEGDVCFKDTFYTKETVPMIFSLSCLKHGQYIIFYNERLNGVSYPDEYSADAFSDLCEVEVYGMFLHNIYHIPKLLISHLSKLKTMTMS